MRALGSAVTDIVLRGAVLGSYVLSNGLEQAVPYYGLVLANRGGAGAISLSWSLQGLGNGKECPNVSDIGAESGVLMASRAFRRSS